ncbi:hypothetical protein [Kribbella sindirgiensis]|uniref:Lipoprotein n=1 Tax=Kribbella sindirgiensis TaxID=1124744 RepID=A0A4R0IUC7_9ACTN|nr:hypothetical protein [Kribbella sindirgiensis]TCC35048.1 hypothetical protein E0H50_14325 [Kribbella sindirgiensis]
MPRRPALGPTTAALCALLALTACEGSPEAGRPNTSPTSPPASTASTPVDESKAAGDAAVTAYRRYIAVISTMTASGGTAVQDLPKVASGVELAKSQIQAERYRGEKIKTIGDIEIIWAKAVKTGPPGATITTASVQACYDTSKSRAVDSSGKTVRVPGTPTRWLDNRDLQLIGGVWKVVKGMNQGASC